MVRAGRLLGILVLIAGLGAPRAALPHEGVVPDDPEIHSWFALYEGAGLEISPDPIERGRSYARCGYSGRVEVAALDSQTGSGFVDGFDGALTLGELVSEGYRVEGDPNRGYPTVFELWIDTGGDGRFFDVSGTTRSSYAGDSVGSLTATFTFIPSPPGRFYAFDGTTPYSPVDGSAPTGTLSQLRAALGDSVAVAVYIGTTSAMGVSLAGSPASQHRPCYFPLVEFFNRQQGGGEDIPVARGSSFVVRVRGDSGVGPDLPAETEDVVVDVRRPDGSSYLVTSGPPSDYWWGVEVIVPPAAIEPSIGVYTVTASAIGDGWVLGRVSRTLTVHDVPTGMGAISVSPASGATPGSRVNLSVVVTRAGALPAWSIPVVWTVTNPAGIPILERTSYTTADGKTIAAVGTSSLSASSANLFLQTAVPGTYTVKTRAQLYPSVSTTATFRVGPEIDS